MITLRNSSANTPSTNIPKFQLMNNMPKPYGSIPKLTKRSSVASKKHFSTVPIKKPHNKSLSASAPYPFFSSLTPTSSFFSFFNSLFHSDQTCNKEAGPVGFMPRATTHTTKTQMSQLDIIASVSSPIDCYYDDGGDATAYDNCSSFSSSSGSSHSDGSLNSLSSFSTFMELDDVRNHVRNSLTSNSVSTAVLSDILCDHYVQTQTNTPPSSSDDIIDVPLETFRMYEAPPTPQQSWMLGNPSALMWDESKEWTLVETLSEKPKLLHQKATQQEDEEKVLANNQNNDTNEKKPPGQSAQTDRQYHPRDTRANAAYLRMIVAEVNMMRSQKIVGPLRPRRVLPKRLDRFMRRPSPLQLIIV